jgi:AmmeMemoRadiSam system protein B
MLTKAPYLPGSRLVVCPHDDYTYVGWLYPATLRNISANTIILFGVAHKARQFGIEDVLVFDSFTHWHGPNGNIPVSDLRDQIYNEMPQGMVIRHDSLHRVEHSLESMLPFLQPFNSNIHIVPFWFPALSMEMDEGCGKTLAVALQKSFQEHNLSWGDDVALVVTTDCGLTVTRLGG